MTVQADFPFPGCGPEDRALFLERGADLWPLLDQQPVFLTGGTGFIGRWLLAGLAVAGRDAGIRPQVTVLSRDPEKFRAALPDLAAQPGLRLWPGDVRDFAFPPVPAALIVHAATDTSRAAAARPSTLLETIVDGTRRVLAYAGASGSQGLLLLSSGAVYGTQPPDQPQVPETYPGAPLPVDPATTYGQAKRLAEHWCVITGGETGLRTVLARGFAFAGPHLPLDGHFAIGNFIRDALWAEDLFIHGDGRPQRSYLYAADLALWLWTLLLRGQAGQAYNVGSDHAVTIAGLARLVAAELAPAGGMAKPVRLAVLPRDDGVSSLYVPAIDRARTELGLGVWTDLATAIRRTARWARTTAPA